MSFNRPTLSEVISRVRADFETRLPGADSRLRHSVLDVLGRSHSGAASGLYGYLDHIANQRMPDSAETEYLERWAGIWGVRRKAATAAEFTVTVTGADGSAVPVETALQRADGAAYRVTTAATVDGGTASVVVEAVDAGAAGDLDVGSRLTFTSAVPGVNAVATVAEVRLRGTDEELDAALRARLLDRIQQPPQGGSSTDYVAWALAQPGVTRAWCYPLWMGSGTVGLSFVMDAREDIIPTEDDVEAVRLAVELLRPVTAELYVFAPTTVPVPFLIRLTPDTPEVRAAVIDELRDFFARESVPGATLNHSRFVEAISLAAGEHHHELQVPADDVGSQPAQLLTLGDVTFL